MPFVKCGTFRYIYTWNLASPVTEIDPEDWDVMTTSVELADVPKALVDHLEPMMLTQVSRGNFAEGDTLYVCYKKHGSATTYNTEIVVHMDPVFTASEEVNE